jgi:hypothetical protein
MNKAIRWWAARLTAVVVLAMFLTHTVALAAPAVSLGPNSRLPYLEGADVWVDGAGTFNQVVAALPGGSPGMLVSASFIVFRPKDETLKPDQLASVYATNGYIAPSSQPVFKASSVPSDDVASPGNAKETLVYKTRGSGKWLVIGLIRNVRTQHQLAFGVVLTGNLDSLQALSEANRLVELYAGEAQRRRQAPPMPTGTVPAGPTARWTGTKITELLSGIVRDPNVSDRVKEMARTVIPQATSINYTTWRTPSLMADQAFIDFYLQQGTKLGWGPPASTDETVPGRPTMLFQRPNNEGFLLIRAQPTSRNARVGTVARPSTTIIVLDVETKQDKK